MTELVAGPVDEQEADHSDGRPPWLRNRLSASRVSLWLGVDSWDGRVCRRRDTLGVAECAVHPGKCDVASTAPLKRISCYEMYYGGGL
jgi:hypothetical protein